MSFLCVRLPVDVARVLSTIDVPGTREDPGFFHLTLVYFGDNLPIEAIAKATIATFEVAQRTNPFLLRTSRITCFDNHGDGCPVICAIESPPLHALHNDLRSTFDRHEVEYSKKWPEYKPHVTLAYSPTPIEDRAIPSLEWGCTELLLCGGEEADQRISVNFPLALSLSQRVARRYQIAATRGSAR